MKKINSNTISDYKKVMQIEGKEINSAYPEISIIKYANKIKNGEEIEEKKEEKLESINVNFEDAYINMNFLGLDLSNIPQKNYKDVKVFIIPVLYVISSFISIKLSTKKHTEKIESEENDDKNINTTTEEIFVDPLSEDVLCLKKSLLYRFSERTLGYNISYKKIINHALFNSSNKWLKIFNTEENCKKYKNDCILFTKDILSIAKLSPNIKYIIIQDVEDENFFKNIKILSTPIIVLDKLDFKNLYEHAFDKIPFPEAENLYEKNLTFDISSLFGIPDERIPEFFESPRDVILEVVNIEPNYFEPKQNPNNDDNDNSLSVDENSNSMDENNEKENNENNYEFYKNIFCGKNYEEKCDIIFKKLVTQISRRILIISKIIKKV